MSIKLINETCYSTEDLELLAAKCKESMLACQAQHQAANGQPYTRNDVPVSMRVGYYQPSYARSYGPKYTNTTGYNEDIRLGIVKSSKLGIAPLLALAQAADGSLCKMPQDAVDELVRIFAGQHGWTGQYFRSQDGGGYQVDEHIKYKDIWSWVDSFHVTYRARAKRGSKKAAKLARKVAKLAKLRDTIDSKRRNVTYLELRLAKAVSAVGSAELQIEKLSRELDI